MMKTSHFFVHDIDDRMQIFSAAAISGRRSSRCSVRVEFRAAVDAAATRPGRLRRIDLGAAGVEQLTRILRWRLGGALSDVVDAALAAAVRLAGPAATPAQAAEWARESRRAAREARREPALNDLLRAIAPRDDRAPADRRVAAVHEAGIFSPIWRQG
jgi:hypothetical protein